MAPTASQSNSSGSKVDLSRYSQGDYCPGRGLVVRLLWSVCSLVFFESGWFPFSGCKRMMLTMFGAKVGFCVVIKPNVRVKFPWRLSLGDHVWIGQGVWIDNLADVSLDSHVCLSQNAYLCTGSHDHRRPSFDLRTKPITIHEGAWVCAGSLLLPGVVVGREAVVSAGSVVHTEVAEGAIVRGNPAIVVGTRVIDDRGEADTTSSNVSKIND